MLGSNINNIREKFRALKLYALSYATGYWF